MNTYDIESFSLKECPECRECCQGVPTCICGFQILQYLDQNMISEENLLKLTIYQIREEIADYAAKMLWHHPNINLIKEMTLIEEDHYNILVIHHTKENCPFLSEDQGCTIPTIKPFNCSTFPYFLDDNRFKFTKICNYSKININKEVIRKIQILSEEYKQYCIANKQNYFSLLKELQKKLNFRLTSYRSY